MKIVIFVWANSTNPGQSGTSDGTRDVIINIHFIISTNIQTNREWIYRTTLICQQKIESIIESCKWKSKIYDLLTSLIKKLFTIKIYKTVLVKVLFNTSEHNLSKSSYFFELTSVIRVFGLSGPHIRLPALIKFWIP